MHMHACTKSQVGVFIDIWREFGVEICGERIGVDTVHAGLGERVVNQFLADWRVEQDGLELSKASAARGGSKKT